jgi:hypothetical protein
MKVQVEEKKLSHFTKNLIGGLGWMIGATLGFTLFLAIVTFVLRQLGGLPIIGDFFAQLIDYTNQSLEIRRLIYPR